MNRAAIVALAPALLIVVVRSDARRIFDMSSLPFLVAVAVCCGDPRAGFIANATPNIVVLMTIELDHNIPNDRSNFKK